MGMYTELMLGVELKTETPEIVINILKGMSGKDEDIIEEMVKNNILPTHTLFKTARWTWMLRSDSYYFDTLPTVQFEYDEICNAYYLTVITNLKNYNNEIEHFIDWITPYVATKGFAGYKRYEEDEHPTLICF